MILQKPLGWVQRYLYNVELGPIPPPNTVLSLDHDWPLEQKITVEPSITVAGVQGVDIYTPGSEKHGLVVFASSEALGGTFPPTDVILLKLLDPSQTAINIFSITNQTFSSISMIGGRYFDAAAADVGGIDPVYVPPGWVLHYEHTSVAGAVNLRLPVVVVERQRSYPLRLP